MKLIAKNRKAYFNYEVLDKKTAGLVLKGWQVKSIKNNNVSFSDSYCYIRDGEIYMHGLEIAAWHGMSEFDLKAKSEDIKLLMAKHEIEKWAQNLKQKGNTIVPLALGLEHSYVKIEIGIGKGKKEHDKRKRVLEKESKRDVKQQLSGDKYF